MRTKLTVCCSDLSALALAQAAAAAPTYIHAGRLIAVPGQAVRGPSTIIVDNGRIVSVTDGLTRVEPGVAVIDLSDKTVLPGLIDSHVHLSSDRGGEAELLSFVREEQQMNALEAQMNGMKTLRAGFTTVRNLGDDGATLALREAIKRGWVQGPRIIDAASSISTTGGHMDGRGALNDDLVAASAGARRTSATASKAAARSSAARSTAAPTSSSSPPPAGSTAAPASRRGCMRMRRKALVDTAHAYGRKVAVHAHGADGIKLALRAGADSIEHGTVMDDEILQPLQAAAAPITCRPCRP